MIDKILDNPTNIFHSLLKYTPLVPAIRIVNNRWVLDESLLARRSLAVQRIAVPILVTISMLFALLLHGPISMLATVSCAILSGAMLGDDRIFTGRTSSEKYIFESQFNALLNHQETPIKNIDLTYLIDYYRKVPDAPLIDIIERLKVKGKRHNKDCWVDAFLTKNVVTHPELQFFLKKLIELKQIEKDFLLNTIENFSDLNKSGLLLFFVRDCLTYFSLNEEEERLLLSFVLNQKKFGDFFHLICTYLDHCKTVQSPFAEFTAKHFTYIIGNYPKQARRIVFSLAHNSRETVLFNQQKLIVTHTWMSAFDQYNKIFFRQQFEQVISLANKTENKDASNIIRLSQQEVQEKLKSIDTTTVTEPKITTQDLQTRALFADAFTTKEDSF